MRALLKTSEVHQWYRAKRVTKRSRMLQYLIRRCIGLLRKSNMSGAGKISSWDNGKSTMYATTVCMGFA